MAIKSRTIEKIEIIVISLIISISVLDLMKIIPSNIFLFSSFFVFCFIFILPGYLIFSLINDDKSLVRRIAISFSLSLGALVVPGFLFYLLRFNVKDFFMFVLFLNILLLIIFLRRRKTRFETINLKSLFEDKVRLLLSLVLVFLIFKSVSLKLSYPYSSTDGWFHISYIRENMNASHLSSYEPFFGTNYRPINYSCSSWHLLGALTASISRIDLINLMILYFPAFLIVICIFSFYTLSREIFNDRNIALFATILQVFYLLVFRTRQIWAAIAHPKFMLFYVVTPIVLTFAIRHIRHKRLIDGVIMAFMLLAMANINVANFVIIFISVISLYGINIIFNFTRLNIRKLMLNLLFILLLIAPFTLVQNISLFKKKDINKLVYQPYREHTLPYPSSVLFSRTLKVSEWKDSKLKRILAKKFADYYILNPLFLYDYPHTTQVPFKFLKVMVIFLAIPLLLKARKKVGYQMIAVNTFIPVILLFNPFSATLIGKIFPPSLFYRVLWLIPETLILTAVSFEIVTLIKNRWADSKINVIISKKYYGFIIGAAIFSLVYSWTIHYHKDVVEKFHFKRTKFYINNKQARLYDYINNNVDQNAIVLVDNKLVYTFPLYLNQNIVAALKKNITIGFGKNPEEGLERWDDVNYFYSLERFDNKARDILKKYKVGYVATHINQPIGQDLQQRKEKFELVYHNEKYALFKVKNLLE